MATALGGLAYTGALCTQISQLFSFLLVHLLEIYTCSSNTPIYSTLGGTLVPTRYARGTLRGPPSHSRRRRGSTQWPGLASHCRSVGVEVQVQGCSPADAQTVA